MIADLVRVWRFVVEKITSLSGRSLRPTASGRAVLFLAFAVGFAAMNTGNNLLFFGWGLILSSIIISGILSESTLQAASATPLPPDELRAGADEFLPVVVENHRRLPGFGVELSLVFRGQRAAAPDIKSGSAFELRLSPGARVSARVPFRVAARGALELVGLRVATAAPFGFFAKERRVTREKLLYPPLVVLPERVDTRALGQALWARLGENPAGYAGNGDELFSLRPWRNGDDPRRIAWRIAAKTGRLVMRENEATRSREIVVDVIVAGSDEDAREDAVATAASLIEDLLADGHSVGVRAAAAAVPPSRSPRQRFACLHALALVDLGVAGSNEDVADGAAVIAVVAGGARAEHADVVVEALRRPSRDRKAS